MTDQSDDRNLARVLPPAGSERTLVTAYGLWLITGIVGGHRYYLGRRRTAVLMTVTLGGLGVWWLIDIFFIEGMVRDRFARERVLAGDGATVDPIGP